MLVDVDHAGDWAPADSLFKIHEWAEELRDHLAKVAAIAVLTFHSLIAAAFEGVQGFAAKFPKQRNEQVQTNPRGAPKFGEARRPPRCCYLYLSGSRHGK